MIMMGPIGQMIPMHPSDFITKWRNATLKERSAAQEHFIDLCRLLGEATPAEADPTGAWYGFEKGAKKAGGGDGWADVWKRGCFAWEYKGKGKDLQAAFKQLQLYTPALEYPPLLIVSDIERIVLHTAFTGTVPDIHVITLEDLSNPQSRQILKWAFSEPERLRPGQTTQQITETAARRFAELAQRLRERGHDPRQVAHFLNKLLFCLFAEDTGLLPRQLFSRLLDASIKTPDRFSTRLGALFQAMATGGDFGVEDIEWFDGGLFDTPDVLPLELDEIRTLAGLARLDWSAIEPSIFGTLFERGLDPDKRSQLGAHFTDPGSIMRLVNPVVLEPLRDEWGQIKTQIQSVLAKAAKAKNASAATRARKEAEQLYQGFLFRLVQFRVLDPACGSGNFLYLALGALKDLEHRVMLEAETLGLQRGFPQVGPEAVKGIEINPYAAELARVTVWIGEIQWMLNNGYDLNRSPILRPLETIEQRDAVMNPDGTEAEWPETDAIIGNPPFLGDKKMLAQMGEAYVTRLRALYKGRVPGGADLVTYWFEKARAHIEEGRAMQAGLVATQSIRAGSNRKVLERIIESGGFFNAWADEPWINEGAAVRVSLVCFGVKDRGQPIRLNGETTAMIHADLSGSATEDGCEDLTKAVRLKQNVGIAFQGPVKVGPFDLPGEQARAWLHQPNPNGRPNADVLRPWANGMDLSRRPSDTWIIDFGISRTESDAALYELPFQYVITHVKLQREIQRDIGRKTRWWIHGRTGEELRRAMNSLTRYLVTPRVAKHRFFVWLPTIVFPDSRLYAIARDDDVTFGILHSHIHEAWALATSSRHGVGNDPTYNAASCFETFPFPEGLTPNLKPEAFTNPAAPAIAKAARELVRLRDNWLNPPEWVRREPEVVLGYPDRLLPVDEKAAKELKKRTLTNLYNQRPAWLANAHRTLDDAVVVAYGWPVDLPDPEVLARLLRLNLERSRGKEAS